MHEKNANVYGLDFVILFNVHFLRVKIEERTMLPAWQQFTYHNLTEHRQAPYSSWRQAFVLSVFTFLFDQISLAVKTKYMRAVAVV